MSKIKVLIAIKDILKLQTKNNGFSKLAWASLNVREQMLNSVEDKTEVNLLLNHQNKLWFGPEVLLKGSPH